MPSTAASASINAWRLATTSVVSVIETSKCLTIFHLLITMPRRGSIWPGAQVTALNGSGNWGEEGFGDG